MSDPVTNAEIEDVLSSIRRLVSEDTRNVSRVKPDDAPPVRQRLVLTPSLRVSERPEPEPEPGPDSALVLAPIEEDVALPAPDEAAPEAWVDEDMTEGASAPRIDDADPPWSDPRATLYGAVEGHAARDAGGDGAEIAGDDARDDAGVVQSGGYEDREPDEPHQAPDPEMQPAEPGDDIDGKDASLGATVEALETAIGDKSDQWEPDGEGGDDYAGTPVRTLEWEDHETGPARQDGPDMARPENDWNDTGEDLADKTPDEPAEAENALGLDPLANEETILDEESLRELVTDIVREELQGALGERITRNVRKLVRREIHRALTAQELE